MKQGNEQANRQLWRYAGMATQFLVSIGIGVWVGLKLDKWLKFSTPILVWVLPLIIIIGMIVLIIKDTSGKNDSTSE